MPYISRIAAIRYGIRSLNDTLVKQNNFYINFITDPISAIKEYTEVGKFIFVSANRSKDGEDESIEESYNDENKLILHGVRDGQVNKKNKGYSWEE